VYPKGLPVGTVIKTDEGNIYKTIAVKPAAALNRLESVLVLLKPPLQEQQRRIFPLGPDGRTAPQRNATDG